MRAAKRGLMVSLRRSNRGARMSPSGLGCAKTLAVAPHVEISPGNCIPESQIILHTRGSMPCWRIVFSTFCGCMSFYTGSVRVGHSAKWRRCPSYAQKRSQSGHRFTAEKCQEETYAAQQNVLLDHLVGAHQERLGHLQSEHFACGQIED